MPPPFYSINSCELIAAFQQNELEQFALCRSGRKAVGLVVADFVDVPRDCPGGHLFCRIGF